MVTQKECIERAAQIVEYLRRNDLTTDVMFGLHQADMLAIGQIGAGLYQSPILTPREMYQICAAMVKEKPRIAASYTVGQFGFTIYDYRGDRVTRKKDGIRRIWFDEHNFGARYKRTKIKRGPSTTYHYRWEWEGHVDDELLMLFRMSIPATILKSSRLI